MGQNTFYPEIKIIYFNEKFNLVFEEGENIFKIILSFNSRKEMECCFFYMKNCINDYWKKRDKQKDK